MLFHRLLKPLFRNEYGFILPFTICMYIVCFTIIIFSIQMFTSEKSFYHLSEENYLMDTFIMNSIRDMKRIFDSNPVPNSIQWFYDEGSCEYELTLNDNIKKGKLICKTERNSKQTISFSFDTGKKEFIEWKE